MRITEDRPKNEYIKRINERIRDALIVGVPEEYVERVVRGFIPKEVWLFGLCLLSQAKGMMWRGLGWK